MTEQVHLHEPSGLRLHRVLMLPSVEARSALWTEWSVDRTLCWQPRYIGGTTWDGELAGDLHMTVGPLCVMCRSGRAQAINVQPTDAVMRAIKDGTITIRGDRMSYRVIDHDNGWSLVLAQHGQIIGSVWLAYIRTETVPAELWPGGSRGCGAEEARDA